MNFDENEAN